MSNPSDNINEEQTTTDSTTCLQADDLESRLNVSAFNQMMNNTASKVTDFVDSYIKEQNTIKEKRSDVGSSLEQNRYRQTAMKIRRNMVEKHEETMKILDREYGLLATQVQNLEHTKELHEMLKKQNAILKKSVEKQIHTIEISDRKTYYENEQNTTAGWWSNQFQTKYKYLIILLIIAIIISKRYKEVKLWVIVIGLALYPTLANQVLNVITRIWRWIRSNSRLVYLHTDM